MRPRPAVVLVSLALVVSACAGSSRGDQGDDAAPSSTSAPASTSTSTTPTATPSTPPPASTTPTPTTRVPTERREVASRLDVPWGLAFLPDGTALLTTRDEAEVHLLREGSSPRRVGTVPGVDPGGEGGLLGIAVSPRFTSDRTIYVYFTAGDDNRVVRMTFSDGRIGNAQAILTGIPKARNHNGGRIAFGPDGYLYVATGDAGDGSRAQDRESLGGKILRITTAGRPAPGNPFEGSRVWSYGHRNVQGLAWDTSGRMYASEFGQDTWDELNLIRPGANYGWPEVEGRAGRDGFVDPLRQWTTDEASPSGIAVTADGTVYMAALRGESLWRISFSNGRIGDAQQLLAGEYGRLRDVVTGPDGRLWVLTSNTFRGTPHERDDRVLIIPVGTLR